MIRYGVAEETSREVYGSSCNLLSTRFSETTKPNSYRLMAIYTLNTVFGSSLLRRLAINSDHKAVCDWQWESQLKCVYCNSGSKCICSPMLHACCTSPDVVCVLFSLLSLLPFISLQHQEGKRELNMCY